jgi:hypothetical protein
MLQNYIDRPERPHSSPRIQCDALSSSYDVFYQILIRAGNSPNTLRNPTRSTRPYTRQSAKRLCSRSSFQTTNRPFYGSNHAAEALQLKALESPFPPAEFFRYRNLLLTLTFQFYMLIGALKLPQKEHR